MGNIFCYPVDKSYTINGKRYVCTTLLGEGGFSFVYLAKDGHRKYALKAMLCQTNEALTNGKQEINILKRFNQHDNIIKLIDSSIVKSKRLEDAQEILILMPYYKHGTLQDLLNQQRTIDNGSKANQSVFKSELELLVFFKQICEAVSMLHHCNPPLSHRDLKPGNILIDIVNSSNSNNVNNGNSSSHNGHDSTLNDDKQKIPILMDFGSVIESRITVSSRQQALQVQDLAEQHSTPLYRAPELFDVKSDCVIDERTDVWALGCILYAMAFNKSPFEPANGDEQSSSVTLAVMSGQVDIPTTHIFSDSLIQLIKQCVSLDSQSRPFIDQLLNDVTQIINKL